MTSFGCSEDKIPGGNQHSELRDRFITGLAHYLQKVMRGLSIAKFTLLKMQSSRMSKDLCTLITTTTFLPTAHIFHELVFNSYLYIQYSKSNQRVLQII